MDMDRDYQRIEGGYSFFSAMGSRIVLLLLGAIFGGIGTILFTVFVLVGGAPWVDWQLDGSSGVKAQAVVTGVHVKKNVRINNRHPMSILYRFKVNEKTYPGESLTLNYSFAQKAKRSGRVEILYLADNPRVNKIVGTSYSFFGIFCLLPFGFAVVGALIFLVGLKKSWRRYKLMNNGVITKGEVESTRINSSYRVNGSPQIIVEYSFVDQMHDRHHGVFKSFDQMRYGSLKPGDVVEVIYDEFFPNENALK